MRPFDYEHLAVYKRAIEFVVLANDLVDGFPRGRAFLASQLLRAATSVSLNIAEGAGEFASLEKARFYRMLAAPRRNQRPWWTSVSTSGS